MCRGPVDQEHPMGSAYPSAPIRDKLVDIQNRMLSKLHVPEPMLEELQENFEAVQTLFSTLGHPILDPLATEQKRSGREVLR